MVAEAPLAHHALVKSVAQALRGPCDVPEGQRIVVAVSGGADSVALLRALHALAPRRGWNLDLVVGHVQHHLREGGEAERDAGFVEALAAKLGLPFLRRDLDGGALRIGNVEHNARLARYEALTDMAEECDAPFVATGHHGDDQLETILMRLLRGASMHGLRGIAWQRRLHPDAEVWLVRPMLGLDRQTILGFLGEIHQAWCDDHTNADISRLRARLRQQVTPALREIRPDVVAKANVFAAQMQWGVELLRSAVGGVLEEVTFDDLDGNLCLDRPQARELIDIVLQEVVRQVLLDRQVPADALTVRALSPLLDAIVDGKGGKRKFQFAGGVTATVERQAVRFRADDADSDA